MSYRLEEKLDIESLQLNEFIYWLKKNEAKVLFPERQINSLYFENASNGMFLDSEEGCTPRKKIRVRQYPKNKISKKNLEIKVNSVEGRFKTTNEITQEYYNKIYRSGYFDDLYGLCYPKVYVDYSRKYFSLWGTRITIDININYTYLFNAISKITDEKIVVELKSNDLFARDKIINFFPFKKIRFSKYCRAVMNI